MKQAVTHQEFEEWKNHSVTKAFYKALKSNREELKENLVVGIYEPHQELEVKGICKSVSNILDMDYEQLMEGYANAK